MAYGFDASSILSSYFEGANFLARGIERAEEERRRQKQEAANRMAGQALAVVAPKSDEHGNIVAQPASAIAQSEQFKALANDPEMQPVLMQGVTDPRVKGVRYVGAAKGSTDETFVPILQHLDADGNVLSEGPLTHGRSSNGHDPVGELTMNDVFNHAASVVYAQSPELGQRMFTQAKQNALGALQEQWRKASDQDREAIAKVALSHGYNLEDLATKSGAKERKVDLERGGWWEHDPVSGKTIFLEDPSVRHVGDKVHQVGTERGLKDAEQKRAQDLQLDVAEAPTRNQLEVARSDALGDARFDQNRQQNQQVMQGLRNAYKVLEDPNATSAQKDAAQAEIDMTAKDPNAAQVALGLSKANRVLDPKNIDSLLSQGPEAANRAIIELASYRQADDLRGLYAGIADRAQRGDRNAAALMPTLRRVMDGTSADKSSAPKLVEFDSAGVSNALKTRGLDEDAINNGKLGTKQIHDRLMNELKVAEGSKYSPYVNEAVADTYTLNKSSEFKNAEVPMLMRSKLKADYGDDAVGSPEEYMKDIHDPLQTKLQKAGVDSSPAVMERASELVTALRSRGIDTGEAVGVTTRLLTNETEMKKWHDILAQRGDGSFTMKDLGEAIAGTIKQKEAGRLGKAAEMTNRQFGLRYR